MQTARSHNSEATTQRSLSRKVLAITIVATSLGFVLVQLDVSIVNVAPVQIDANLRTGVAGLQWVVDSYALVFASLLLFAGALADRIGARKAFMGRTPMLSLDFFRNSTFSAATLVGVAINLTLYGVIFILSLYLQQVRHYSPIEFGIAFLPFPLVLLVSNLAAGWLNGKGGSRLLMVVGLLIAALRYWLLYGLDPATPYIALLPGLLVIPLGIGLAVPAMTTALLSTAPRSRSGIASGVLNIVRQTEGAIGVALFGSLMAPVAPLIELPATHRHREWLGITDQPSQAGRLLSNQEPADQ